MEAMCSRSFVLSRAFFALAYLLVAPYTIAVGTADTTATPVSRQAQSPASAQQTFGIGNDARIRREVLDSLARELESRYVDPDMGKRLAAALRAKQKANAYKNITTLPELARVLTEDLYAIAHDKHLRVNFSFAPLPTGPPGPPSQEILNEMRKENGAISKVEILDGNVGYMRVNGVPPIEVARSAIAASFAFLQNTDALIIDNRGNGGGDPNTVALYVSYLSEGKSYVVNTFHWREGNRVEEFKTTDLGELAYGAHKPVFVLTSPATFSGGEELAYDLQASKRATIVGEVTGGGANPGGPIPLGHQFVVNMPSGRAVNPITGTNWEGVGVKPDIPTTSAVALSKAHALAIERLRAAASDPMSQSMLDAVSMKLETIAAAESGSFTRLPDAQLLGSYVPEVGAGTTVTILEKDGRLIRHIDGLPDRALIFLNGNRYRPEGLSDGFAMSFRVRQSKAELLLEQPSGPSVIRVKQ
jgi:hypothetical protein